jgi:hypothetical protein
MNQTVESTLGFLSKFLDIDILHQGIIEVALGIVLHLDTAHSTSSYNFYRYQRINPVASTNLIKEVDFRVPLNPDKAGQEFLYILLEPTNGLDASAIIKHYGQPLKIVASTPQQSAGSDIAVTYVYLLGKRDVSFSFNASPQSTLLSIAMEKHNP